ncbi:V-type ATP synthase subunit D [Patescibacteria group bacterium]|nr:V-type ATP synthase subunit D [Patescibacteria group bacterium]MBU1683634.1 V-type ATP synthase subunit D [Patescibacteria group bacterium]MBU1935634.1 V-type ATP synthase subunit D [Patescibacteria group bacterium]
MAILNVNATRMALLTLKKKIKSAKRGHKLLKDKQDGLMQKFMEVIREAKAVREEVEQKLGAAFKNFIRANSLMEEEMLEGALLYSTAKTELKVETKNVMSVRIPHFKLETEGEVVSYGFLQTSGELDIALQSFQDTFPLLIKLAEIEKSAEALAEELEKTRRRVNALEYRMIPDLKDTIKFIQMKLGEMERGAIINTMVVKAKIQAAA